MRQAVVMASALLVACGAGLLGCPCPRRDTAGAPEAGVPEAAIATAASSTRESDDAGGSARDAAVARVEAAVETVGTVRLLLQHVEATCGGMPGEAARSFPIGVDLLVETSLREDGGAPAREHVFCPKAPLPDGGKGKPRLATWENCRQDASCVVTNDGGASAPGTGPVSVTCGKDGVDLVVEDGKTILRGSFGTRVVAPHPMRILPVVKARRLAYVDC
jgi:hypothetical protein